MEFSKFLGVANEECSSSESGWTMYIVSPVHETSYDYHHHHHGHDHDHDHVNSEESHGDYKMYHNEDSDDSMVSDASSRPSREAVVRGNSKKRSGLRREFKHKVNQRQMEKKLYDRRQRAMKEGEHKTRIDIKPRMTN